MKRGAPEVSSCQLIAKSDPETSTEWAMMLPNTETFDEDDIWISPLGAIHETAPADAVTAVLDGVDIAGRRAARIGEHEQWGVTTRGDRSVTRDAGSAVQFDLPLGDKGNRHARRRA